MPTAPGDNLFEGITITRIDGGRAANLSWPVLSVDMVGSNAYFEINYSQSRRRRQVGNGSMPEECKSSGCRVRYERGGVIVRGLNPDQTVSFNIFAVNEEGERGNAITFNSER